MPRRAADPSPSASTPASPSTSPSSSPPASTDASSKGPARDDATSIPRPLLDAYAELAGPLEVAPLSGGLLHRSLAVRGPHGDFVLQRVSDVFEPGIHANIDAVTRHLARKGITTFELVPTRSGALFVDLASASEPSSPSENPPEPASEPGSGGRWRLLTRLPGVSCEAIESLEQARSAGVLVGRFHAALEDFEAELAPMGLPFRDTPLYLARMRRAIAEYSEHPQAPAAARLADALEAGLERLGAAATGLPERVIHGDLKLGNLLFADVRPPGRDRALALIDLDTLMRAPLWCEWGDAWRSWCARAPEDAGSEAARETGFDLAVFEASVLGFRDGLEQGGGRALAPAELDSLVLATERLALELAARFVTDMLEESYFAWDAARFASAGEHNRCRAETQLALFESAWACRDARARILAATGGAA